MVEKKKGGGMATRRKEQQLQQEIETQEEWEDMLSKEGLCVVDVYSTWCGLCHAMTSNFKKYRNDLNDQLLKFFAAKADTIDALEKYRGRCEPCFLFFAGGTMVAVIRGANAPLILRTITEQLAQEHKVLDGQAERKEIKDTIISQLEAREKAKSDEEEREKEEEEAKKEVSVVIIKPDAVQTGKAEEIMGEMTTRGIEILRQEERHLTEDEVRTLYSHLQDEEYFEDLVKFMSSSPCIVLAITKGKTGENIIKEFRDLIGPPAVEEAKEQAPESLRAKYGSDTVQNAVHAADSHETAIRELAFFFPDFVAPTVEGKAKLQRTLALIRPDAYKANKDEILAKIRASGFKVAMQKEVQLNKEQVEEFYSEHRDQEYFEELTNRMSSGPLFALGLAREDAIEGWRQMLGPTEVEDAKEQAPDSLRAQYAVEGTHINMLHGSSTEDQAQKEIEYFFPMEQTVAVIKPDAYQTKDEIVEKIHEAGFRIAARKETTLSREMAEEFYGEHKDKDYFNDLMEHMVSGPTMFMVLSREGAVEGWRSLIGKTDPNKAKEADPESLRGQYGIDLLKNAVHGSSNVDHAMSTIQKIFAIKIRKPLHTQSDVEPQSRPISTSPDRLTKSENDAVGSKERPTSASVASFGGVTGSSPVPALEIDTVPDLSPEELEEHLAEQAKISYDPSSEKQDDDVQGRDTPTLEFDTVPDVDPEQMEAMLAEQREISYEPAPEFTSEQERRDDEKEERQEPQAQMQEEQQEPVKTEQEETKEPEAQAEPQPEPEQQEKVKSPEPQQETEEKKAEPEPQAEGTGEGEAQQQEEAKEEPKQEETTQEESKKEPTQQQEEPAQQQEETQEKQEEAQEKQEEAQEKQEETQEKQEEKQAEPEPAQTSEEKTEEKTETQQETTEQKTDEQKTDEQKTDETVEEKKEETT